jgi:CDP-diacylglycerol--glycerol-3-phosphate 3-phosphatidyltransferase
MRTADKFTFCRILLAPVIFIFYFIPSFFPDFSHFSIIIVLPLTIFAEFTDFLDGFYARRHNSVSDFGKIFDPFADVMLHLSLFVAFTVSGYLPPFMLLLILYREFSMLFIRLLAVQKGVTIAARKGGKAKTFLYVVAVFFTLALEAATRFGYTGIPGTAVTLPQLHTSLTVLFTICVGVSYVSFIDYLIHFKYLFSDS